MFIEETKLTEQEENIVKLLGLNNEQYIYDFKLDDSLQSIQINTYELKNNSWRLISGSMESIEDTEGRLAFSFEKLAEGLRVALQSRRKSGSNEYTSEPIEETEGMSITTSMLKDKTEILYEVEIPLVIQIMTTKNVITSYNLEYFNKPDEYGKHGYEYVHAVTIKFSQKTVSELSDEKEY
jgi:hypothetical protein